MRSIASLLLPSVAVFAVGCSSRPTELPTYPVRGEITCAGKPAVGVRVFLVRADGRMPPEIPMNPRAMTDDEGRFVITTYRKWDGAPEGDYVLHLHWPTPVRESADDRLAGLLEKSKLDAKINPVAENVLPPIRLPTVDAAGKPLDTRPPLPES
jgi:5-hydroxyisourate hydrolase-like protein (transthyretin family)